MLSLGWGGSSRSINREGQAATSLSVSSSWCESVVSLERRDMGSLNRLATGVSKWRIRGSYPLVSLQA